MVPLETRGTHCTARCGQSRAARPLARGTHCTEQCGQTRAARPFLRTAPIAPHDAGKVKAARPLFARGLALHLLLLALLLQHLLEAPLAHLETARVSLIATESEVGVHRVGYTKQRAISSRTRSA